MIKGDSVCGGRIDYENFEVTLKGPIFPPLDFHTLDSISIFLEAQDSEEGG